MTKHIIPWPHGTIDYAQSEYVWLRLLGTSDVHAHLMAFDYSKDEHVDQFGLVRTATLIKHARSETPNSLLFDNGDFLQGSALSDLTAMSEEYLTKTHPVISAMNALRYDAACLGNHEFNFGLETLKAALAQADFPVVCANAIALSEGKHPEEDNTWILPFALLPINAADTAGEMHTITVGVIGLLPPQITTWDHAHLRGRIISRDIVQTARDQVPKIRAAGADIIVALAHTGIEEDAHIEGAENAANALSSVPGIDAVFAGHTHNVFPHSNNPKSFKLSYKPTTMPGFRGSHLGVIDLLLSQENQGWRIIESYAEARAVKSVGAKLASEDPDLMKVVQAAHEETRRITAKPVTRSTRPLHSYMTQVRDDGFLALIQKAQKEALRNALEHTEFAELPILSAASPFKTGGNAGASYYTDVPAGPISLRHISDIYPFPNTLIGLSLTGSEVLDWLERAASCFHQIAPGEKRQLLWNSDFAGHAFDTVYGLTYEIDLTQQPRHDVTGTLINPSAQRIRNAQYLGHRLSPSMQFAVATNNFRAFGGGQYPAWSPEKVIFSDKTSILDILSARLRASNHDLLAEPQSSWRFSPIAGASVLLETGPGLRQHQQDIEAMGAIDLGDAPNGFARFEFPL